MNIKSELHSFTKAIKISQILIAGGAEVRFIGGCIRDILIGKIPTDIDLATNFSPQQVQNILEENKIKCFTIGKEFGTIIALINAQAIEITTLRKDLSCDGRYAKVEFTDNWQEDAQRRDFTINALSAEIDGEIYDYFDGISDLKKGIVRFIGNPEERISEDYLRILRFFRFSAYFADSVDVSGLEFSKKYANNLKDISGYRIRSEMSKIFAAPNNVQILKVMEQERILQHIIPCDIDTIKSLEKIYLLSEEFDYQVDELLCWAVFFVNRSIIDLQFSRKEKIILEKLISVNITNWDYANLKKYWQKSKQYFKQVVLLNLAISDVKISKEYLKKLFDKQIEILPVTGKDLLALNIKPDKKMGLLLNIAEQIWYDHEFKISKTEIIKELLVHEHKF